MLHLVSEGKVLHDTGGLFQDVCTKFTYRESYIDVISQASAVIWFFSTRRKRLESRAARKRLTWAMRTILIARAAEQRRPIFSSAKLADFAETPELKSAIDKRYVLSAEKLVELALHLATHFGISREALHWPRTPVSQREMMLELGGVAAGLAKERVRPTKVEEIEQPFGY